ncbi:MAG: LamG-like jellyroll fold domain-containing protein [Bacteroidota bacterium]
MHTKYYLIIILLTGIVFNCISQNITNYAYASSNGTFTALSSPTNPSFSGGDFDDGYFNAVPINFDFWYMGVRYTTVSLSTNGWLTLGANITNSTLSNSLTAGGAPRPVIAPLWDDIDVQVATNVSYLTTGSAPNRVFTVQYLNTQWQYNATGNTMSFQVKLYESTGKVEFIYRRETGSLVSASASIGLSATATGSGNFLSVSNSGSSVSSTTQANVTSKPATGKVYDFTPPLPIAPGSLTFSDVAATTMTLNWTDNSSNESGFVVYQSTDGINYSFINQTAANTLSSAQTGLTEGVTYYWKVYAVSEGGLSTAISGSQITCTQPSAPTVTSPVNYCQNATATQLTATGSNLLWGAGAGSCGGTSTLTTTAFVNNTANNKKTTFTTTASNVIIASVDYYIPAYQSVSGLVLSLYNSGGTVIATSSTNTTLSAGASAVKITAIFNYTIATAGNYSVGTSAGSGNIGSDNPSFPITETSGTINVTGVTSAGFRCFNNISFSITGIATAPTPVTTMLGTVNYLVSQTIGSCTGPQATIVVNVSTPTISQLPTSQLIAHYKFEGNANNALGTNNGTLQNSPTASADRFSVSGKAYSFNGTSQYVSTADPYVNPDNLTVSIWFKTSTTAGGRLIGFGNLQTGSSAQYDRHLYMNNAGQIYFAVYPGSVVSINSALSYNDNIWHLATATLSSTTGMALYIDGVQVGSNGNTTAQNYTGYWRIGYDNLNGWTSQPSSFYFNGALDDALIYSRAISASEVTTLYTSPDGAGNNGPVCMGASLGLSATTISGATYAWTGPNSYTSSAQNPTLTYSGTAAGAYKVDITEAGCTASAYTNVVSTTTTGQWTGNISTDWAVGDNWCSGVVPTSTTNVIITSSATRMPSISSSVTCNNLTINSGATLTTTVAGTLNISGTLTNSGTMTNSGTTNFNGTSGQQTFSGVTTFYNLTLTNSSGLLLPIAITVNNNLLIASGTLNANNFNIAVKGNWTNNVSTSAFTAGTATVTFNGTTAQAVGGSFVTTFNNLAISSSANTVTLNVNAGISGDLSVNSGTFDLASFTANRASAGGILYVANNATLKIGGTNTYPTNYTTNTLVVASTVEYSGTNQTVQNVVYGNLVLSSSSGAVVKTFPATTLSVVGNLSSTLGTGTSVSFTAAAIIAINGNVSIGASTTFNGGSFSHSVAGNWMNGGTFEGNTSTVTFTGPGKGISGSGTQNFNNLTIAASLFTFSNGSISLSGNLATISSGSVSQASGGTILMTGTSKTISGSGIVLDNLTMSGSVSSSTSFNLTGNLSVSGSFTSSAGSITMSGSSKTISGAGTKSFNVLSVAGSVTTDVNFSISSGLIVNGSLSASAGTVTFTGVSSLSGTANLFNTTLNGTSLQLSSGSTLGIANILTITAGTLNVTSSIPNAVNFNGTGAQNINAITYHDLLFSNGNTKTATGNISINNDITIGTSTTFDPSSYTLSLYGDWINNGTFIPATSTVQVLGPATAYVTGATTFNILTSNTSSASTELILNNNVSAAIVNMTNGMIVTDTNTLTITNTRTGNGHIHGYIQRTHTFTTGVSYAFEGPNNTINFSAVSGVTSVTVFVAEGPVGDFPYGNSISRVYDITVPSGTYTATLRLHYEDDELNGNVESDMGLWNYDGAQWLLLGKLANDSIANYVEQSGLTTITNRWTISINPSVVMWTGSVSSDWHTAANWAVYVGPGSTPPSANDVVVVGGFPFTYQPSISTAVTIKNLVFASAQAVTLSMATGGSLTSGDISGVWSANATHTLNVGSQVITVNGDLKLSDGVNGHAIDLTIGSGSIAVKSLEQTGNAAVTFSGAGTLFVDHDYLHDNGVFTAGTGTVEYNGDVNQHMAHISYNNVTINKASGIAAIDSIVTIAGNLLLSSGQLDNSSTINILGNVTISSGATLLNNYMLHVGGNWLNNGTYIATGAHIVFNGSGTQTISASTFNNMEVNKPVGSTAELTGNIIINGDLTVHSGTLNIKSFNCDRPVLGGNFTLEDSATFIVGGNNIPVNFSAASFSNSSIVIADGTSSQAIYGTSFGHIIFRNAGTKTLTSPITVNGNLTVESGATFNAGSQTLTLNGNWINAGTFTPAASTILCSGTTKTISGVTTFNRISVNGSYTLLNNITLDSLLIINSSGALYAGSGIHVTMNGDLINSGILYTLGSTTFTGNALQTLSLINAVQTVAITVNFNGSVSPMLNSTSAPQFGFININNTGGVNPSVGWTIAYALTVGNGASFNGGASTHNILGSLINNGTITSSGVFNFVPASVATISFGANFSSTGRVNFGGAGAITLAGTPVAFKDVVISNTNGAGITPSSAWTLTNNFTINSGSILNAGNYTHSIGGNILINGTLNSSTSTLTLNGTAAQDIYTLSAFNNLTINKAGGSTLLSSNATVNGILNFVAGTIRTGSNRLIQPSSGTITGAGQNTGWVSGNLQKYIATGATAKPFEVGDTSSYTPLSVSFSSVTTAGTLTASSTAGDHPNISSSSMNASKTVNRFWSLANSGIVFTNYTATYNFVAGDIDNGASTASFSVGQYNGSSWVLPVTVSPNSTNIQASGVTEFGDFIVGEVCNGNTTISYSGSPYCANAGTASVTLTGNVGGVYSSIAGLSINASTGAINLAASTPGTYTVNYTVDATGDCPVYITTTDLTISVAPTASLNYADSIYPVNGGTASVTFFGTTGGKFSSTAGLSIDTTTGIVTLATSIPGSYTVTYTLSAAGGCSLYTTTANIIVINSIKTWDGGAGTDNWGDANNWSIDGVPTANDDVLLTGANTIDINVAAVANNLIINEEGLTVTILSGNSLTVSEDLNIAVGTLSANGTALTVGGDWTNNGMFTPGTATVIFNGDSLQNISGDSLTTFINMTVNKSDSLKMISPVEVSGTVTLSNGTLVSSGNLTLLSNASGTARIGQITGTGALAGNVTIQRFIPGGVRNRTWRFLASPAAGQLLSNAWQQDMHITGSGTGGTNCPVLTPHTNGLDATPSAAPSMYTYNEPTATWIAVSNTNATTLNSTTGYRVFVRGDRTQGCDVLTPPYAIPEDAVLKSTGAISTGTVNIGLTYTSPGGAGWNLVPNPYPSAIDWNNSSWVSTRDTAVNSTIYIFNPAAGTAGQYASWHFVGGPVNGGSNIIQSGQSFFVKTTATRTLSFNEAYKAADHTTQIFGKTTLANVLKIQMLDTTVMDEAVIFTYPGSTHAIGHLDGEKLSYAIGSIASYTSTSSKLLTYNAIGPILTGSIDTLLLKTGLVANKSYSLNFIGLSSFSSVTRIYLFDKFTGGITNITGGAYAFSTTAAAPLSFNADRFYLLFTDSTSALPVNLISFNASKEDNTVNLSWSTSSEIESSHFIVEKSVDASSFIEIAYVKSKGNTHMQTNYTAVDLHPDLTGTNYYRLKQVDYDGKYEYSELKSITWDADDDSGDDNTLSVYPNPAIDKVILSSKNKLQGIYDITIYTMEGTIVKTIKSIDITTGETEINVSALDLGIYFIKLSNEIGTHLTAKLLIHQ